VKQRIKLNQDNVPKKMITDSIKIECFLDNDSRLEFINLTISNLAIKKEKYGNIICNYLEVEDKIYKVTLYISNIIFMKVGINIVEYEEILNSAPTVIDPETFEELQECMPSPILALNSIGGSAIAICKLDLDDFQKLYNKSPSIATYSDGLRIKNIVQKYEQFYMVIEYFFNKESNDLDKDVSNFASKYDKKFTI